MDHSKEAPSQNNLLLMYLLQNRAEDFIRQFEMQDNRCFVGIYSLYRIAYANKLILSDKEWSAKFLPIVENGRKENQRIISYLSSLIPLPKDFHEDFAQYLKPFAWFDEDDDFEYMLDASLDRLLGMGYREIDCLLYEAGLKFNFKEMCRLLALGANPYVKLSAEYALEVASKLNTIEYDVYTLFDDARNHLYDCVDLYGIGSCWTDGFNGKETKIDGTLIRELLLGAGCKLVCETIHQCRSESLNQDS